MTKCTTCVNNFIFILLINKNALVIKNTILPKLMGIQIPPPVFSGTIEASDESKEPQLLEALDNLSREDPSFHYHTDRDSGQLLISGMGELHMEIIKDRLLNHYQVAAFFGKMQVSYRVTVQEQFDKVFEYSYELTGAKQSATVRLIVDPFTLDDDEVDEVKENLILFDIPKSSLELVPFTIVDDLKTAIKEGVSLNYFFLIAFVYFCFEK